MSIAIPRKGAIGRFLNPFPFNMKEHASITLMASAASQSALATEALAAQDLFYGGYPNKAAGIFVVITAQLIGFGLAGLLRDILVYPTYMLWPMNLPITSLLESLHKDKAVAKARLKIFYIVFFTLFVWEVFPEVSTSNFYESKGLSLTLVCSTSLQSSRAFLFSASLIKTVLSSPTSSAVHLETKVLVFVCRARVSSAKFTY